jgi:hypothetical protein
LLKILIPQHDKFFIAATYCFTVWNNQQSTGTVCQIFRRTLTDKVRYGTGNKNMQYEYALPDSFGEVRRLQQQLCTQHF